MRVVFHDANDLVQLYDLTEDEKRDVDFRQATAPTSFSTTWAA